MHYTYIIAMLSQNLQSLASVVVSIHFFCWAQHSTQRNALRDSKYVREKLKLLEFAHQSALHSLIFVEIVTQTQFHVNLPKTQSLNAKLKT